MRAAPPAPGGAGYGGVVPADRRSLTRPAAERPLRRLLRPIVWCQPADPVREVARRIGDGGHSSALVRTEAGLGIVTDHDFRHRVATGELSVDAPISALATVPVLTIDEAAPQSAGLLRMVEHAVHHLVVTGADGAPIGVVRAVDLAQVEVRDPLMVRAAIEAATTIGELADAARRLPATIVELHDREVAALHIGAVHAAIVDAIIRRVLRLRADPVLRAVRHSWVVLGSLARRESLPLSDVDTALVWEEAAPWADPELAARIRAAAGGVLADLRRCGLLPCPNGTSADQPAFSRSRADWTAAVEAWRHDPTGNRDLLRTAMVADSRPLTEAALGRCLTDPIRGFVRNTRVARALLTEALGFRPPTGLVRDFVVEHSGEHRGELDLKRGGLAPVVALARWVSIITGDPYGSTPERLRRGAGTGLLTHDEALSLTVAYEDSYALLLGHEVDLLRAGLAADPTGAATLAPGSATFIAPRSLDSLTRRHLRESFRAIRSVQARLDEHWLARLERTAPAGQV